MNQLDYVDICPGESVLFKCNLREFRMIYAFSSAKKRYEKTFVHIINNTLMRTILEQLLFDKLRICCGNYKGSTRPFNIEGV